MKKSVLLAMGATLVLAPLMSVAGVAQARSSCAGLSAAVLAERVSADKCDDRATMALAEPNTETSGKSPAGNAHDGVAVAAPAVDEGGNGKKNGGNGNGGGGKNGLPVAMPATDDDKGDDNGGNANAGGGKNGLPVALPPVADGADKGAGGDDVNQVIPVKHKGNQPKKITKDDAGDHLATQTWLGKDHDHDSGRGGAGHDAGGKDASGA